MQAIGAEIVDKIAQNTDGSHQSIVIGWLRFSTIVN